MQFVTLRSPQEGRYHSQVQRGGRGHWFHDFYYAAGPDPTSEGIVCFWSSDPQRSCFKFLRPDIEIGCHHGTARAVERGVRICSTNFTVPFAKYHDVDTTPEAIQKNVCYCVMEHLLPLMKPIEPLRPEWFTSVALALAKGICADAATDRYPILSDALRDAGCEDALIHDHLQLCPDHGPSCWVVEMILEQMRTDGQSPSVR